MSTIYQAVPTLPPLAATIITVCVFVMLAALAVWLVCESIRRLVQMQLRLEDSRNHKEAEALDNWKRDFEAERSDHINDVAKLRIRLFSSGAEISLLKKRIEEKDKLLSMVPLSVLEEVKARAEQ